MHGWTIPVAVSGYGSKFALLANVMGIYNFGFVVFLMCIIPFYFINRSRLWLVPVIMYVGAY